MEIAEGESRCIGNDSITLSNLVPASMYLLFTRKQNFRNPFIPCLCMPDHQVAYIWSQELQDVADCLPANAGRSSLVHGLIYALELLDTSHDPVSADFEGRSASPTLSDHVNTANGAHHAGSRALVVPPNPALAIKASLLRYHDAAYVG